MVNFKIYDKKIHKFIQLTASEKVWEARYKLGIWNNSINNDKLGEMYKIMKRSDKHLELYVKIKGSFKPVSKEVIDSFVTQYKKKTPKRKNQKLKENNLGTYKKLSKKTKKKRIIANL